jgi:hypothetical protein
MGEREKSFDSLVRSVFFKRPMTTPHPYMYRCFGIKSGSVSIPLGLGLVSQLALTAVKLGEVWPHLCSGSLGENCHTIRPLKEERPPQTSAIPACQLADADLFLTHRLLCHMMAFCHCFGMVCDIVRVTEKLVCQVKS